MTTVLRDWTFAILWVFTLSIPWEAAEELPSVGTLSRGIGLLAVPIGLVALVIGGRKHRILDAHLLIVFLAAWTLASMAWSIRPTVTFQAASTMLQLLAMMLLLWEFGRDGPRQRRLMWAFVLGALVGSLAILRAALVQQPITTSEVRLTQGGLNENSAAFVFSLAIPVAWYLSLTSIRALQKWVAGLYVPIGIMATVLTGSRGGLLSALLALSIIPLTLRRGGLRLKVVSLIGLLVSFVFVVVFVPPQTMERLKTIPTELTTGDLNARQEAWGMSWTIFGSHPVTGVGAGASRFQIEQTLGLELGPHNTYLSLAADLGVVGLGLFVLVLMSVTGRWMRLRGWEAHLVGVLLMTLTFGLLPGHREYLKVTWLIIAIMLAEAVRARPVKETEFAAVHERLLPAHTPAAATVAARASRG